ncbi:uncharacterized protein LOC144645472 isoform X2 [Oculina patagonica]
MSSGQEGVMFVREQRVVEEGVEMTSKTFIAATDEGALPQPTPPRRPEAWPAQPQVTAPTIPQPPQHVKNDVGDVRKKSCSNCLEDFCCLYDINSDWYELKGKGVWCVLFLLLGYLILGVLVLAAGIVVCVCAICYLLGKMQENCYDSENDDCFWC